MSRASPLASRLITEGLKQDRPTRTYAELIAEHRALQNMLSRIVKLADSGRFRDHARLSIGATPIMDDARELLAACEALTGKGCGA